MKLKKRYVLLFIFAVLSLYNVFHFGDYCYGILNTFRFIIFSVLFSAFFLIITFYNLYKISTKTERFDFVPGVLSIAFYSLIFLSTNYSNIYFHKSSIQSFIPVKMDSLTSYKIILFDDNTFERKTILEKSECVKKGSFFFKNDSLYLVHKNKELQNVFFDTLYFYNKKEGFLSPNNNTLEVFKLEE
jgi:hypothetical protein